MSWPTRSLIDCVRFLSGGTPNKGRSEYWDGDIPWVSSAEMTERHLDTTSLKITQAGLEAGSRLVPAGTTFAVVRGMSLAKEFRISLAPRPMAFNQDVKALIPRDGVCGRFIFYALAARADAIRDLATEAAHGTKKLEMDRLESVQIALPPLEQQRAVADAAYCYDNLISTNQRRIALLEQAARLLYREWFVHLRFPGHEAVPVRNGVPDGWLPCVFSDLVAVNPRTKFDKDQEHPFVDMTALSEFSMVIGERSRRKIGGGAKFKNGDTLFARITP
jgi:type I restriction enzyme S subunit